MYARVGRKVNHPWCQDVAAPATLLGVNLLGFAGQLVEIDATVIKR
jgi:hypothetical protein